MNTVAIYTNSSLACSEIITRKYSTSFSWAIKLLHRQFQPHIHAIYGFVRLADEIVDTFHSFNKTALLHKFRDDTFAAISDNISLNPVLQSFQNTVNTYNIDHHLITAFLESMEMDLDQQVYTREQELNHYIYGSAEVVGLMCLKIFCEGRQQQYEELAPYARLLGAAFQKVNFLRDLNDDCAGLQRTYFPGFNFEQFDEGTKKAIEASIDKDFREALAGIKMLPVKARFGVYVAYRYYLSLFNKIKRQPPSLILQQRVRVHNMVKIGIILNAGVRNRLNMI